MTRLAALVVIGSTYTSTDEMPRVNVSPVDGGPKMEIGA
jgi:hypothetical protein